MISEGYFAVRFDCEPPPETKDWIITWNFPDSKLSSSNYQVVKLLCVSLQSVVLPKDIEDKDYMKCWRKWASQDWSEIKLPNLDINESDESDTQMRRMILNFLLL
ncbi:36320_t:CDS:2 [Racocetra persica]|uniref:36319_t:CDS:1 n=2 Tax=Racocetra persica TaxID=160502 RepID=A0ACA9K8H7_9GLOM|nr:36319_t:CDS:2 [Racocetra persica]CAG8458763.1 36320_t:CDS:2 [Racocetra persica]